MNGMFCELSYTTMNSKGISTGTILLVTHAVDNLLCANVCYWKFQYFWSESIAVPLRLQG